MFQAMEYKELLAAHKKALAEYSVLQKNKAVQDKGKQTLLKERLLVDDYKHLLRWKLGDAYSSTTSGMKAPQLKQLWEVWKDTEVADIDLPPPPLAPSVPEPGNTALGRTVKRKFDEAITAGDNMLNEEDFLELAEKFQRIAQQKGITIAFNNNNMDQTQHNNGNGMGQAQRNNANNGEQSNMEEAQRDNADDGEQPNMEQAQHDNNAENGEQLQHV